MVLLLSLQEHCSKRYDDVHNHKITQVTCQVSFAEIQQECISQVCEFSVQRFKSGTIVQLQSRRSHWYQSCISRSTVSKVVKRLFRQRSHGCDMPSVVCLGIWKSSIDVGEQSLQSYESSTIRIPRVRGVQSYQLYSASITVGGHENPSL